MDKFKNKYRIPSARLKNYDYGSNGAYFITICVNHRLHHFGECTNGKMKLSPIGEIVERFWYEIPEHFDHVYLGEFVVMPNHLHGILILDKPPVETLQQNNGQTLQDDNKKTLQCNVSTVGASFYQEISPKSGSVSTIIRSYKSICTKRINQTFPHLDFEWQTRFWDHIIRNGKSYDFITNYILSNPENWTDDMFYLEPNYQ